jgi:hypothetical protein
MTTTVLVVLLIVDLAAWFLALLPVPALQNPRFPGVAQWLGWIAAILLALLVIR